jgi:hypothetical protein
VKRRGLLVAAILVAIVVLLLLWMRSGPRSTPSARSRDDGDAPGARDDAGQAKAATTNPPSSDLSALREAFFLQIKLGVVTPTLYRFDASTSRDHEGQPLSHFEFDFGDGNRGTSQDGRIEHDYAYPQDAIELVHYDVKVIGYGRSGTYGRGQVSVDFLNTVGLARRNEDFIVETKDCLARLLPEAKAYLCVVRVRNTHDAAIAIDRLVAIVPSVKLPREGEVVTSRPGSFEEMTARGEVVVLPAVPPFPAVLEPGKVEEVRVMVPEASVPPGTQTFSLGAVGHVVDTGQAARISVRATIMGATTD